MTLLDRAVNFVDKATQVPGKIRDFGEDLNDRVIRITRDLEAATNMAGDQAERNLTDTKVRQAGSDAFSFIQKNITGIVLVSAAVIAFIMWRK